MSIFFLHDDDDAKAVVIPRTFSANSQAKYVLAKVSTCGLYKPTLVDTFHTYIKLPFYQVWLECSQNIS